MPDARVQLAIQIETEGAEQLTSLRRELEALGATGAAALAPLDAALAGVVAQLRDSRQIVAGLEPIFRNFFQSLIGQARNFRDVVKRLLLDLLEYFLGIVRRMVAGWLSGLRLMSSFASVFFGGLGGFGFSFAASPSPFPPSGGGPRFAGGGSLPGPGSRFAASGPLAPPPETLGSRLRSFQSGGLVGPPPAAAPMVQINFAPGAIISPASDPRRVAAEVVQAIKRRARDQGLRRPV